MAEKKKAKRNSPARKKPKDECTIPGPIPVEALGQLIVSDDATEEERIRSYVEWQAPDEKVKHLEKLTTEHIFGQRMDAWDVRTTTNRWWVITNPTNLYSQELFPSLDYTLSFHVGVTTRMEQFEMSREHREAHDNINQLRNRLANARATLFKAKNVEDYQSVGMKCREGLLFLIRKLAKPELVPKGQDAPQLGNFVVWCELIANEVAAGSRNDRMRSHLKDISRSTWQLASWLTHAQNADRIDASITCDATENVIESFIFTTARNAGKAERAAKRTKARR
jgi:hypothetical protein